MSQISEIIHKAIDEAGEGFDARVLAPRVWAQLDEESRMSIGLSEIVKRLKQAADSIWRAAERKEASAQAEMPFDLPGAVPMDVEGRRIRKTATLLQAEFRRAGDIRAAQIEADRKALREWRDAEAAASPYWRDHPDWTFGQCMDALIADQRHGKDSAA